jgi:hypothetical protein
MKDFSPAGAEMLKKAILQKTNEMFWLFSRPREIGFSRPESVRACAGEKNRVPVKSIARIIGKDPFVVCLPPTVLTEFCPISHLSVASFESIAGAFRRARSLVPAALTRARRWRPRLHRQNWHWRSALMGHELDYAAIGSIHDVPRHFQLHRDTIYSA